MATIACLWFIAVLVVVTAPEPAEPVNIPAQRPATIPVKRVAGKPPWEVPAYFSVGALHYYGGTPKPGGAATAAPPVPSQYPDAPDWAREMLDVPLLRLGTVVVRDIALVG